ncbi:MAG: glycosyl hydrolase 2 galactose-binding domain-containing protein [Chloroflexota bacterium]
MRERISLDGPGWWIRAHLGTEAALQAVAGPGTPMGGGPRDQAAGWLPARVPGSVTNDLWRTGEIADPHHERNSLLAEWVPERAWTYRRALPSVRAHEGGRVLLRFDGVDDACHVFVDGERVRDHDGMFVPFEVDVSAKVAGDGDHELAVVVEPAPDIEPQTGRTSRVRVHKSRMGYGWDFCPRLVHQGIWQSVGLEVVDAVRVVDVWARPVLADNLRSARVKVRAAVEASTPMSIRVEASLEGMSSGSSITSRALEPGQTEVEFEVNVDDPWLWWPNGIGEPVLHRLFVRVAAGDGRPLDERAVPVGFRHVELAMNEGGPSDARPYTFVVNGRRIYANGWNWVPADVLHGATPPDRVEHLVRLAGAANVNLLRVWGGGLIETEAFYEACDRLGILVWQEFSQSSSGVENEPSRDPAFVELMKREAEAIVPLRRNHPSLAVWCGGNELEDSRGPLEDNRSPVLAALHEVVERLDPGRGWLPTSPTGPQFFNRFDTIESDPDGLHDVHGLWEHQGLDKQYELYDRGTSLLNSEFGVEGMTNRRTHGALISEEHRWPADRSNPVYRHLGDWWINEPLLQAAFAGRLRDLESLRRASHLLQADGLRYAVEANRRRWPRQSGSLPWQFNEPYPNAWCTSVVDHRGDPKPAYFAVARAYAASVVCARIPGAVLRDAGELRFEPWAWSRDHAGPATILWRLVDASGRVRADGRWAVELPAARDGLPVRVASDHSVGVDGLGPVVFLDLALELSAGNRIAANRYRFATGENLAPLLDLPAGSLAWTVEEAADGAWIVDLRHESGPAIVGVRLEDDRPIEVAGWAEIDDGGFDLLPGETRRVAVRWAGAPGEERRLRLDAWNAEAAIIEGPP